MGNARGRLFLIEMIIIILFFAIASAVCMNIFARAKRLSDQSVELTAAVSRAQYAAEVFKGVSGDEDAFAAEMGAFDVGERSVVYYDENWLLVSAAQDSGRRLEFSLEKEENGLRRIKIAVIRDGDELYGIETAVLGEVS